MNALYESWTDHNLSTFMNVCNILKCGQSSCDQLEGEARAKFIQAFYAKYDTDKHIANITKHTDRSNGFPVFHIVVMDKEEAEKSSSRRNPAREICW